MPVKVSALENHDGSRVHPSEDSAAARALTHTAHPTVTQAIERCEMKIRKMRICNHLSFLSRPKHIFTHALMNANTRQRAVCFSTRTQ